MVGSNIMNKQTIILLIALITLSTGAMAYVQKTYATKEVLKIFADQLTRIETKVDILIQERTQK